MSTEQPRVPSRRSDKKRLNQISIEAFEGMLRGVGEEDRLRTKTSELLERVVELLSEMAENDRAALEKLEEIRYALADNETGVGNLLRQVKISNRKLEELIDQRE